jgi:hypothetical protein
VVRLAGSDVRCFLFCLRLSFSGKAVHRASLSGGQEAFFEGHEHAFRVLGGVPAGKIRYGNLKAAVAQVIGLSRSRVEADRWTAFRSSDRSIHIPRAKARAALRDGPALLGTRRSRRYLRGFQDLLQLPKIVTGARWPGQRQIPGRCQTDAATTGPGNTGYRSGPSWT